MRPVRANIPRTGFLQGSMEKKTKRNIPWKQLFLFTKDGRIKSLDLLYGFFLAVAALFVDFLIGNRLTILFEDFFTGQSRAILNVLDTVVPTALCALLAALLFRLIPKKRIVLIAYWIAWVLVTVLLAAMLFLYDRDTLGVLFWPFFCIFWVPAAANAAVVTALYARWRKRNPDPILEEEAEMREEREP